MRAHHVVATGRSVALSIRRYLWPKCLTLRYVDHISWWRNCRRIDFDNNSRARHVHQRHGPPMSVGCHAISTSKVITKDLVRLVRLRRRLWLAKWQRCVHVLSQVEASSRSANGVECENHKKSFDMGYEIIECDLSWCPDSLSSFYILLPTFSAMEISLWKRKRNEQIRFGKCAQSSS